MDEVLLFLVNVNLNYVNALLLIDPKSACANNPVSTVQEAYDLSFQALATVFLSFLDSIIISQLRSNNLEKLISRK